METTLKQLIKEAILEALVEFTNGGVSVAADNTPNAGTGGNSGSNGNSGQGGDSGATSGGGTGPGGRPKPDVGVGIFGLR